MCVVLLILCRSLGLAIPPRIRFLQKEEKRKSEAKKKLKLDASSILEMFKNTAKKGPGGKKDIQPNSEDESESEEEESGSEEEESGPESGSEEESGSDEESGSEDQDKKAAMSDSDRLNFDLGADDIDDIMTVKTVAKLEESGEDEEVEIEEQEESKVNKKELSVFPRE